MRLLRLDTFPHVCDEDGFDDIDLNDDDSYLPLHTIKQLREALTLASKVLGILYDGRRLWQESDSSGIYDTQAPFRCRSAKGDVDMALHELDHPDHVFRLGFKWPKRGSNDMIQRSKRDGVPSWAYRIRKLSSKEQVPELVHLAYSLIGDCSTTRGIDGDFKEYLESAERTIEDVMDDVNRMTSLSER